MILASIQEAETTDNQTQIKQNQSYTKLQLNLSSKYQLKHPKLLQFPHYNQLETHTMCHILDFLIIMKFNLEQAKMAPLGHKHPIVKRLHNFILSIGSNDEAATQYIRSQCCQHSCFCSLRQFSLQIQDFYGKQIQFICVLKLELTLPIITYLRYVGQKLKDLFNQIKSFECRKSNSKPIQDIFNQKQICQNIFQKQQDQKPLQQLAKDLSSIQNCQSLLKNKFLIKGQGNIYEFKNINFSYRDQEPLKLSKDQKITYDKNWKKHQKLKDFFIWKQYRQIYIKWSRSNNLEQFKFNQIIERCKFYQKKEIAIKQAQMQKGLNMLNGQRSSFIQQNSVLQNKIKKQSKQLDKNSQYQWWRQVFCCFSCCPFYKQSKIPAKKEEMKNIQEQLFTRQKAKIQNTSIMNEQQYSEQEAIQKNIPKTGEQLVFQEN